MGERNVPTEDDAYLLSQFLDGGLTQDEERAIQARLESDAELAQCLDDFRRVDRLAGEWGADAPEVDWTVFEGEFQRRRALADRPVRQSLVFKLFAPMAAAAALFVAFTALQTVPQSSTMFVEIGRAVSVSGGSAESFVSYGPRRERAERAGDGVVIAFARVGGSID